MIKQRNSQTGLLLFPTLGFILAFIIFFFSTAPHIDDYIGGKQAAVIRAVGYGEQTLSFVDTAARLAAQESIFELGEKGGFYFDKGDDPGGAKEEYPCDRYGYNLWNSRSTKCWPSSDSVKQAYINYFNNNFKTDFLSQYPDKNVKKILFEYEIKSEKEHGKTLVTGMAEEKIPIPILYEYAVFEEIILKSDIIPEKEPLVKCCDGACVATVAEHYYNKYGPNGAVELPYVWGGVTPYSIDKTKSSKKELGTESFFDGAHIHYPTQPRPHEDRLTVPGFDCSGFVWWVYKHAELDDFYDRKNASDYEKHAQEKGYKEICGSSKPCTSDIINNEAEPGDLLFKHSSPGAAAGHVAIYAGGNEIIDSSSTQDGVDKRPLPGSWLQYLSVYRFPYNTGCSGQGNVFDELPTSPIEEALLKIGALSEKYEASDKGSSAIGYDTVGKTSYGKYQIASGTGTMDSFLLFLSTSDPVLFSKLSLAGLSNCESACSPDDCYLSDDREESCEPHLCYKNCEFAKTWKQEVDKGSFDNDIEHEFIKTTHYDPAVNAIKQDCKGLYVNERSFALQNVLWSTAVQHGPTGAARIFKRADASPDKSDEKIIKAVYNERSKLNKYFSGSSSDVKKSLKKRFLNEEKTALEWLKSGVKGAIVTTSNEILFFTETTMGHYYVTPSFTTEINYNLGVYDEIVVWARLVYETCSGKEELLSECVDAEIKKQNDAYINFRTQMPGLSIPIAEIPFFFMIATNAFCDDETADYYAFIETFENCLEFGTSSCYCDFPSNLDLYKIEVSNKSIVLHDKEKTVKEYDFTGNRKFSLLHNNKELNYMNIEEDGRGYSITYYYKDGSDSETLKTDNLYFVKNGNQLDDYTANLNELENCQLEAKKHKFRFCAVTPQEIYTYDKEFGIELQNVPVMFALDLYDAPPPPITEDSVGVDKPQDVLDQESELSQEKECDDLGKAEFKLEVTTADLKPAYESFITSLISNLLPQLKVLLFAKNFLVLHDSLPALITVQLDLKGASEDCDIKGIVYKCGVGVAPYKNDKNGKKFDFSNPTGFIDLSQKFASSSGYTSKKVEDCLDDFVNPDGSSLENQIRYKKPQIDRDMITFSVDKCIDPILQYKKMSGLDIITSALQGFGYYFAFAYVDSANKYGNATVEMIKIPSVLDQLQDQMGLTELFLLKDIILGDYEKIFGLVGLDDELKFIKRAIAGFSLDRLLSNLPGSAAEIAYKEVSKHIKDADAKKLFDDVVEKGKLGYEEASELLKDIKDELTPVEIDNIIEKLRLDDLRDAFDFVRHLPLDKKKELLALVYDKAGDIKDMTEREVDALLMRAMRDKESVTKILKALELEDKARFIKDLITQKPEELLGIISDVIGDEAKIRAVKDVLETVIEGASEAKNTLARMMTYLSPDYVKKAVADYITDTIPGFDKYKDILSIFKDLQFDLPC